MSNLANYKIGTTGPPIPGTQVKIADDGEILIKGDHCISGYWKMPEETKELFTKDGWLMSGDIGKFDENGFLMITDRKKDLIITSGGKNVAPQKIENLYKSDPLFTQFVVIGERKKYLSALCNINIDIAEKFARDNKISYSNSEEIFENEDFLAEIDKHVADRNTHLARYETIKKYRIVKNEFSQDTGELTASLKIKRRVISDKYADLIESMYEKESV